MDVQVSCQPRPPRKPLACCLYDQYYNSANIHWALFSVLIHTASYEVGPVSLYSIALIKAYWQLSKEKLDW